MLRYSLDIYSSKVKAFLCLFSSTFCDFDLNCLRSRAVMLPEVGMDSKKSVHLTYGVSAARLMLGSKWFLTSIHFSLNGLYT